MSPPPPTSAKKVEASATAPAGRKRKGSEESKAPSDKASKTAEQPQIVDVMALEEMQSLKRSPESDSELYASNCALLREILDKILLAKLSLKKGVDGAVKSKVQSEVNELRVRFGLAFINLKKLNRLDKLRTKRIRENTSGVMQRVDQFHLQLQNLKYEVMHLQKEVTKCLQFRSADEDIKMVPEEEFHAKAPQEIKQKVDGSGEEGNVENDDEESARVHRLRLARLEFERVQRMQMHETVQKLNGEERAYGRTIGEKKSGLAGLKPQLAAILEKTRSVQEYLDMPLDDERDQLALSRHLPPPLFVLFSEMRAYGHACDKDLKVEILGELDEAKTFNSAQRNTDSGSSDDDEEGDGAGSGRKKKKHGGHGHGHEEEEEEEDEEKMGEEQEHSAEGDKESGSGEGGAKEGKEKRDEALKKVTKSHPLTVGVKLDLASNGKVELAFAYLTQLKIVTVKVSLTPEEKEGSSLLSAEGLLAHLLCGDDDGSCSPNPTTFYLMRRLRLRLDAPGNKAGAGAGSAYRWAQVVAGLQFPDEMPSEAEADEAAATFNKVDKAICQATVETVVKAIKQRVVSRLALVKQVTVLESAKKTDVDLVLPADVAKLAGVDMGSSPVRSKVRAWYGIDYEQYVSLDITSHLVGEGAVCKNDFFYRLQVNRDPATLIALISISPDYPTTPPVFCLNLHWNGASWTLHNSEKVRALEREINTCYRDLVTGRKTGGSDRMKAGRYMLTLQIRRLMTLFDVLLESWNQAQVQGDTGAKVDFPREKIFLQPVRGRTRAPPLRHDKQLQIFTQ